MTLTGVAAGSAVRFNTYVCTSTAPSDGYALNCDDSATVSSNIFAYNSRRPMGPSGGFCRARYSLFDSVADSSQTAGPGNLTGPASTFFANVEMGDFNLSATSPAVAKAQPGLGVTEDFEGRSRPNPVGSTPDIGAFEAP